MDDFDDRVRIYGSNEIKRQWLKFKLKEKILITQEAPTSANLDDIGYFTDFIQAITKEIGDENAKDINTLIYRDLKSKYLKQENLPSI